MKRWTLLLVLLFLIAVPVFGQTVTLRGDALYVSTHQSGEQFVIMKDGMNEIQIELGPASFLAERGVTIATGDSITILGSRQIINNSELIVAREVTKSGKTIKLRDASGTPLWK